MGYIAHEHGCIVRLNTIPVATYFYFTPSLWVSSERFILQAGVTFIPAQHLFGCQTGFEIGGQISVSWKFNSPEF